jgi:hypothetical protein
MSATLDPAATPPTPLPIPSTAELRARLAANVREHDAICALLRVSLKHDKFQQLRAKVEAATDGR